MPSLQDAGRVVSGVLPEAGLVPADEPAVLIKNNCQHQAPSLLTVIQSLISSVLPFSKLLQQCIMHNICTSEARSSKSYQS